MFTKFDRREPALRTRGAVAAVANHLDQTEKCPLLCTIRQLCTWFRPAAARSIVARGERSALALTSRSDASATQICEGSSSTGAHRRRASPRRLWEDCFPALLWIIFCSSSSSWSLGLGSTRPISVRSSARHLQVKRRQQTAELQRSEQLAAAIQRTAWARLVEVITTSRAPTIKNVLVHTNSGSITWFWIWKLPRASSRSACARYITKMRKRAARRGTII